MGLITVAILHAEGSGVKGHLGATAGEVKTLEAVVEHFLWGCVFRAGPVLTDQNGWAEMVGGVSEIRERMRGRDGARGWDIAIYVELMVP